MYFKHKLALKHGKFGVCEIPAIKQNSLDLFGGHSHHMNFDERPQKAVAHRDIEAFVVHTGKVWASLDDVTTVAVQMAVENRFKHQVGSHTLYQVQPGSFPVMNMFPEVEFTSLNKRSSENSLKLGRVRSAYWGQYSADFFKNFLYTCDSRGPMSRLQYQHLHFQFPSCLQPWLEWTCPFLHLGISFGFHKIQSGKKRSAQPHSICSWVDRIQSWPLLETKIVTDHISVLDCVVIWVLTIIM